MGYLKGGGCSSEPPEAPLDPPLRFGVVEKMLIKTFKPQQNNNRQPAMWSEPFSFDQGGKYRAVLLKTVFWC